MKRMLPEEVYRPVQYDEKRGMRNFLIQYREFFDKDYLQIDKAGYLIRLHKASQMVKGVDWNQNVLILLNDDWHKELFLQGFLSLGHSVSYLYLNYLQVYELFWDGHDSTNTGLQTISDIKQKVFCVYIDKNMYSTKTDVILNSIMVARDTLRDRDGSKVYTWVFYRGTKKNMTCDTQMGWIPKLFQEHRPGYYSLDLNVRMGLRSSKLSKDTTEDEVDKRKQERASMARHPHGMEDLY